MVYKKKKEEPLTDELIEELVTMGWSREHILTLRERNGTYDRENNRINTSETFTIGEANADYKPLTN